MASQVPKSISARRTEAHTALVGIDDKSRVIQVAHENQCSMFRQVRSKGCYTISKFINHELKEWISFREPRKGGRKRV